MESDNRYKIIIFVPTINSWETDNLDAALHKIESMVGKIKLEFIDNEKNLNYEINDERDYQSLLERYGER